MLWKQEKGGYVDVQITERILDACRIYKLPFGVLAGTCECESNFRLGLVSSAGALGPFQILPQYKEDYFRYAGFSFNIESWGSIEGVAAVFATYAKWGWNRGYAGDDVWRFALETYRWGQNSNQANFLAPQKRAQDVERKMTLNDIWYDTDISEDEDMEDAYRKIAAEAEAWAETKLGYRYSQEDRDKEDAFDCSSLVARAYQAVGAPFTCKGAPIPTSTNMVYDDQLELLWPTSYEQIGQVFGGTEVLKYGRKAGDLQFLNTMETNRKNKITHVTIWKDEKKMVHARSASTGVVLTADDIYAKKKQVLAILRFNPEGELRQGMIGDRVRALQAKLNGLGANLTVDGIYGAGTEKARQQFMPEQPAEPELPPAEGYVPYYASCDGSSVNIRTGPSTEYMTLGLIEKGAKMLAMPQRNGWCQVTAAIGELLVTGFMSQRYVKKQ